MNRTIETIAVILLLTAVQVSFGQSTNEEKAYAKGMAAIELMENGEIEKSLNLLEEAKKLDSKNINYPYEIAYAQYLKKISKQLVKRLSR
jgi:uncharacterized membrane protein YvbJ